ncbi:MAG: hypothetical protein ABIO88_04785 [Burkholderiaceae bacterium]
MKKILLLVLNMAAALSLFTFATSASAQLGSLSTDLVFTPVTPCRIMDTRNAGSKSGILLAGSVRNFWGWASNFSAQGGVAASCGTLTNTNEAAIVVNFTVVTPDTAGWITAFPYDATQPVAATVNFNAGAVVGNNATLKLNQTGTGDDFKIYSTSNVHVVADIVGYYAKPIVTALQCLDTANTTVNIAAGGTANAVAPACTTGYTQTATNCEASDWLVPFVFFHNGTCSARNNSASAQDIRASRTCCRVPGR